MKETSESGPFDGFFHGFAGILFIAFLVVVGAIVLMALGKNFCLFDYTICVEGKEVMAEPAPQEAPIRPTELATESGDTGGADSPEPTQRPIEYPQRYLSEGSVPASTEMDIFVESGTIHVLTSGPICVAGVCLPGGENRGSVVIFLPSSSAYAVSGLVPGQNWHGAYYASQDLWQLIAEDRVASMKQAGNCTDGVACTAIDLLVVGRDGVVVQEVR